MYLIGGLPLFLWGFVLSTVLLWHDTFTINSLSHLFGTVRYKTTDTSKNNWFLALLTLGEGWHNNHHHYMASARQGFFWWEIDITYYTLKLFAAVGLVMLDAPISGSPVTLKAGQASLMVGGDAAAFDTVKPVLEAIGDPERIFHLGPAGSGYAVKLLLNLMWFVHAVATAEALTIGVRAGVPLDTLHAALVSSPANSVFLERDILPLLHHGDYDEGFAMELVTKDLGLAVDLARDVGVPADLSALVEQIHRRARAAYGDHAGEMSAVRLYEDLAGTELRWPALPEVPWPS